MFDRRTAETVALPPEVLSSRTLAAGRPALLCAWLLQCSVSCATESALISRLSEEASRLKRVPALLCCVRYIFWRCILLAFKIPLGA